MLPSTEDRCQCVNIYSKRVAHARICGKCRFIWAAHWNRNWLHYIFRQTGHMAGLWFILMLTANCAQDERRSMHNRTAVSARR